MSSGQVQHVDVVAYPGAIWSGIIITKYLEFRALACGYLHDIWHQVVWRAAGGFADVPAGVRTDRIKITQITDAPLWVALIEVAQHLLDDEFAMSVRISAR